MPGHPAGLLNLLRISSSNRSTRAIRFSADAQRLIHVHVGVFFVTFAIICALLLMPDAPYSQSPALYICLVAGLFVGALRRRNGRGSDTPIGRCRPNFKIGTMFSRRHCRTKPQYRTEEIRLSAPPARLYSSVPISRGYADGFDA